jgi:DegV family protein with EDD domain
MYLEDIGDKFIHIIDSKSASAGETIIVHELLRLIDQGLSAKEIQPLIDEYTAQRRTYFMLECFNTMVASGRMNAHVAKLASMLNIVPICAGVDGRMALLTQARGRKKAYSKLADIMIETGFDTKERSLYITHVDNYDEALTLSQYLDGKLGFASTQILPPTGLVCTYADYHGLIVAF